MLQGKDHVETAEAVPGDIAAVAKIDEIEFDAVLHDSHDEDQIHLRPLEFPTPMYGLAIEPKKRGDEQRISDALHKIAAEDPTFRMEHDADHARDGDPRSRRPAPALGARADEHAVQGRGQHPAAEHRRIRETITAKAEGHCRHKKQTGGAGQFGEVYPARRAARARRRLRVRRRR